MRKVVCTPNAPAAIGTYSQGIISDGFVFTSGQIGINPKTGDLVKDDFEQEVKQILENLKGVLEAGGSSMGNIIKITVFLTDLSNFSLLNQVFSQVFESDPPARSAVQVSALPAGATIEMEAIGRIG